MFLLLLGALIPPLLIPALIITPIVLWMRSKHAYINESYIEYLSNTLLMGFSFFSLVSQIAITLAGQHAFNQPPLTSFLVSFILPALTYVIYLFAIKTDSDAAPYELRNNRVYPKAKLRKFNLLWVAAAVGVLSILKPYTTNNDELLVVLALVLSACTLFLVFNARKDIAAMHHLKREESRLGIRYTFGNLEEIRQWRADSWFARTFASLYSASTKHRP